MKHIIHMMAWMLLITTTAHSKELVDLRTVSLMAFMQGDLVQPFPIDILVPTAYQGFEFEATEPGKYFWMRPKDAKQVVKKQALPTNKGFMYGKITMNVGYDISSDVFVGIEEDEMQSEMAQYFAEISLERAEVNGHPVLLVKMLHKELKQPTYLMYIATKISTNVVVIAYIPPKYNQNKGDYVWARQLAHFKQSKPVESNHDASLIDANTSL